MTPTKARELARDAALDLGCIRQAIGSLADQVEALTKERDEYKLLGDAIAAGHKECVRCLGEALQDTANVAVERDALAAVAKMALDALESLFGVPAEFTGVGGGAVAVWRLGGSDKPRKAITALRQAGVQ